MRTPRRGRRIRAAGFTLIEIVMAMIVLSLVTASVFTMLQSTMRAAASIQRRDMEEAQVTALRELLRQTFGALPSTAGVSCEVVEDGEPALQELTIAGVPEAFAWGTKTASSEDLVFSLQPQFEDDGRLGEVPLYVLSMTRDDFIAEDEEGLVVQEGSRVLLAPDDEDRYWFPLIRNVQYLEWGFYNEDEEDWDPEWDEGGLPRLIQLEVQVEGRATPMRVVFPVIAAEPDE